MPNVVCAVRLVATVPMAWSAWTGRPGLFLALMVGLLLSDWIDGKLAVLLDQRTDFGARLDSVADAVMYIGIGLGFWWLESEVIAGHWIWFAAVALTWGLSAAVALLRFGGLPSYHTWGAKVSWLGVALAALHILFTGEGTFVPWALGLVVLANVEAAMVGLVLPEGRTDVRGLFEALRIRRLETE